MSIKKVTLASLILLSLTACSSGSNGNSKAEANRQAIEKAKLEKEIEPEIEQA